MATTVERGPDSPEELSPKDQGRQLRHVRRQQGLSRSEVARSAGLTRRELAAYERGRVDIPESDLWCLAGSCGVDVGELIPHRDRLRVDSDLSSLAIGDTIRHLRSPEEPDGILREYLAMVYELRNLAPGSQVPLRDEDLRALADALGGSPDRIEARLHELIGANREEAARLRAMILPPLSLPAPDAAPGPADFFATPRAADPFAPPPAPDAVAPPPVAAPMAPVPLPVDAAPVDAAPLDPAPLNPAPLDPAPLADPLASLPADPFSLADPTPLDVPDSLGRLRPDPFAPPGSAPADGPDAGDPGADAGPAFDRPLEPLPHVPFDDGHGGIVVDLGEPTAPPVPEGDPTESVVAPHTVLDVPAEPRVESRDDEAIELTPVRESTPLDGGAPTDETSSLATPEPDLAEPDLAEPEPAEPELAEPERPDTQPVAPIAWHAPSIAAADDGPDPDRTPRVAAPRFTRAGADWLVGGMSPATAMADDGALALRRADARWALCDVRESGDFIAEAELDFTAGTGFGMLFRASLDGQERLSGYSFDVDMVAGGGGYLLRQWEADRPHWRPLAQAQVTDHDMLLGRHTITLSMRGDQLTVEVDGETIVTVPSLSRLSVDHGREPCRGDRLGIQAAASTEVTVDRFAAAGR